MIAEAARLPALSAADLAAYLERVEYDAPLAPDAPTLAGLHIAHATHIPFENLDILLGRAIRIDADSLHAKLVASRRGGYCYEQNLLFARVLQSIGFPVSMLAARVRYRTTRRLPRTHMLLQVEAGGERWIADVGFGGEGLLLPVPLRPGETSVQHAWTYRLNEDAEGYVMQALGGQRWQELYAFSLEPQWPVDYEVANHYVSTHPESRFVRTLAVQLPGPDVRHTLRNRTFIVERGAHVASRTLADDEILAVLDGTFGLRFPAQTRFRFDETFA